MQVSASELFSLASLLEKPIEYFFGAVIEDAVTQKIISALQKADENTINDLIILITFMDEIDSFKNYLSGKYTDEGEMLEKEDMISFYEIIVPYFEVLNKKRNEALALKEHLENLLSLS